MRVLYFTRGYTPHDYRFLSGLSQTEHEVGFLCLEKGEFVREERPLPERIESIEWRDGRRPFRWRNIVPRLSELREVLQTFRPDLIHAGPVQQSAFLAALSGFRPLVTMSWGSDLLMEASRRIGRWSARYTLSRSSVLLCDCETVAQQAVSLGMKRDRIVVFPWGVDLDLFSPGEDLGLLDELGWTGKFVLLSTRSWEPIYGPEVLIQGFIQAAEKHPDLRMIMMGGGSLEGRIKDALQQAGLSDRVFFAGSVANDQLPDYYRAADLYVSASFSDGSSVSLLEAMACGTPALVSDIPANREWVERGKSGWWFRCGDALSLAEKVKQIRSKTDQLATVGKRARQLAEERANWEINFRKLLGAYQVALEREGISL